MRQRLGIVVALCAALALCFALVGCGGVDKSKYQGAWALESGNTAQLDADSIALMKNLGLAVILSLDEGGTGSLDMFGQKLDVTWEAKSDTEGSATIDGSEITLTLEEDKLTLSESDGSFMTFARYDGELPVTSVASATSASADAAAATTQTDAAEGADAEAAEATDATEGEATDQGVVDGGEEGAAQDEGADAYEQVDAENVDGGEEAA